MGTVGVRAVWEAQGTFPESELLPHTGQPSSPTQHRPELWLGSASSHLVLVHFSHTLAVHPLPGAPRGSLPRELTHNVRGQEGHQGSIQQASPERSWTPPRPPPPRLQEETRLQCEPAPLSGLPASAGPDRGARRALTELGQRWEARGRRAASPAGGLPGGLRQHRAKWACLSVCLSERRGWGDGGAFEHPLPSHLSASAVNAGRGREAKHGRSPPEAGRGRRQHRCPRPGRPGSQAPRRRRRPNRGSGWARGCGEGTPAGPSALPLPVTTLPGGLHSPPSRPRPRPRPPAQVTCLRAEAPRPARR